MLGCSTLKAIQEGITMLIIINALIGVFIAVSRKKKKKAREGKKNMGRKCHIPSTSPGEVEGMETLIAEALAKIKPTHPLRLAKQAARRNRN
jgi:hypothetical protein